MVQSVFLAEERSLGEHLHKTVAALFFSYASFLDRVKCRPKKMTCERYMKDEHFSMLEKIDSIKRNNKKKNCYICDLTRQAAAEDCCIIVDLNYTAIKSRR